MEPLKNLFSEELVRWMVYHLARQLPATDSHRLFHSIIDAFPALELKARAQWIADRLHEVLPNDAGERLAILEAMLHPDGLDHHDEGSDEKGLCGWAVMPLTLLVGQRCLTNFDAAMHSLKVMTQRFSSEFGIRYCLRQDPERAISIMAGWTGDPNRHVRRLVSEGARPRLPWAMQLPSLIADPSPGLDLLERLKDDPDQYVRRSVANHLNDISKDHPDLVVERAEAWMAGATDERRSLLRHGLRTLIKKGDPQALALFGKEPGQVRYGPLELKGTLVRFPGNLDFAIELQSIADRPASVSVDYVIHLRRANGSLSTKVFKGGEWTLAPLEKRCFRRSHAFRPITTRRYYPGEHQLQIRINGIDTPAVVFELEI
ncbi:DNA alkylation repair protein [Rhizobium alvei]|uniref:DNA alkylation repair protein n=1 Tax=Rhizobium alvei TaxID=1132659 RepID=A0ABT8YMM5_9HYPH|nr:DNA alkylation repair protein [Rhizobium alvei]MDO6964761.1 DNA alkylation repair protein [Rhizobium alvei]